MVPAASNDLQALLDLGSRKLACAIVETGTARVLSHVTLPSSGFRAGDVRDPREANAAVVRTIVEAERMAGAQATSALVAVGGGFTQTEHLTGDAALDPPILTAQVITRLRTSLIAHAERGGRIAIHIAEGSCRLDGRSIDVTMNERFGRHFEVDLTTVTVDLEPLRRVIAVVEATGLPAAGVVPAGLAAAMAVTTAQDRARGVAAIDIGAEKTTVATFADGRLTGLSGVALGTSQLMADVATALQVTYSKAERITCDYGIHLLAHAASTDAHTLHRGSGYLGSQSTGTLNVPTVGPDVRAALIDSFGSRLDTLLRLVADRLDAPVAGLSQTSPVVLTGGGSQMPGLAEHAAYIWGRQVACVVPTGIDDRHASLVRPDAAVIAGMVIAAQRPRLGVRFEQGLARKTA